jgi:hypothetical protein
MKTPRKFLPAITDEFLRREFDLQKLLKEAPSSATNGVHSRGSGVRALTEDASQDDLNPAYWASKVEGVRLSWSPVCLLADL